MAKAASSNKPKAKQEADSEFSFRELMLKSLNYLPLFFICLAISLTIAVIKVHYQTPIYSTSIKLLLKDVNNKTNQTTVVSDQVLPEVFSTNKTSMANETEILRSETLMEKVVLHQQLNTVYYSVGKVNSFELFSPDPAGKFVIFSAIKDSSRSYNVTFKVRDNKIYVINGDEEVETENHKLILTPMFNYIINIPNFSLYKPDNKYSATWNPTASIAGGLAGSLGISPLSKEASILIISTTSQVPQKSEIVLNSLVDEYNNYNIEQNNRIADNTIRFIDERLLVLSGELNQVENNIKDFKEDNALDIAAQGGQAVSEAKNLQDKLNDQELQVKVADMISDYVDNPSRKYELVPSNLGLGDGTLNTLIGGYNADVVKRESMLKTLNEKNLDIRAVESEMDDYRAKIRESINNVKQLYNSQYSQVSSRYNEALSTIHGIPEKEKQLLEIERQQGIKEKLYLYLLEKKEESAVSRAAAIGKSQPIDTAKSGGPINLQNSNFYLMALFLGLGIPLFVVYLMDLLNDRVTTRDEILKYTETPIIGEISHFAGEERKIVSGRTRGILPEQFRIVRTNLRYFLSKEQKNACILVTSTMPGEGKTFVSLNLAAVLAVSGKKTVLIEFDMRRPKVSEALKTADSGTDLPAFLAGTSSVKDAIRPVEGVENLYAITTSFVPPNPAELLLSEHMPELFQYLKQNFDYVIIDTPPLGIVSDAKVLSEFADLSLFIVRQRFTQRKQLNNLETMYQEKKLPNLALIVNDVKIKGIRSYYGYGYTYGGTYGYDYSMGYGYSSGNSKKPFWKKLFSRSKRKR